MLSAFVSEQDCAAGKAFVIVTDSEEHAIPQYYLSPAQVDEFCERLQLAKLQAIHGPAEYR